MTLFKDKGVIDSGPWDHVSTMINGFGKIQWNNVTADLLEADVCSEGRRRTTQNVDFLSSEYK